MNKYEKLTMRLVRFVLWPMLQLVVAIGSAFAICLHLLMGEALAQATMTALAEGISPTSMASGNMPQASLSTYYNRSFLENLKAKLVMLRMCTRQAMPVKSGQIFRNFMWPTFPANTTQQTEGTVGTGISITANFQDYQLGQWADYLNISDKALVTSISEDMVNLRREMAYRLGLSIDDLVMANFDYLRVLDTKTANLDATTGTPGFTKAMLEQAPFSLMGQNAMEMDNGTFNGKIHPFFIADMVALDTGNNSIVDIWKRTDSGQVKLEELPGNDEGIKILELFGCRWMESTNCTQTTNWKATGNTAIRTYLAGKDAVIAIKLDRPDRTDIEDGQYQNMTLWAGEYKPGQVADPAGVIGAGTSYNAILAFGPPPDTTSRARCWDAVPVTT
jgi:hypothetical protein